MRKFCFLLLSLFVSIGAFAQILEPVKWDIAYKKISDKEGIVQLKATVEPTWHLYSQYTDEVFIPLKFDFRKQEGFKRIGKVEEPKYIEVYDDIMQGMARYFDKNVTFEQRIEVTSPEDFTLDVFLTGQSCSDISGMCIPFMKLKKSVLIPGNPTLLKENEQDKASQSLPEPISPTLSTVTANTQVRTDSALVDISSDEDAYSVAEPQMYSEEAVANLETACGEVSEADNSFWGIFIQGFLGGFVALLMPCIFPMIPLTVSFFTKQSKTRRKGIVNALIYAISIIVIYTALGFLVTLLFGPEALNQFSTNGYVNLAFFLIFVIFAISFFGAFELTLPQSLVNKVDSASNKGGMIGIFFMAFTLSLVSFSCTGPIIGTLLVEAAHGGSKMGPLIGMFGFSLALALPFALFAIFPGWLQSMPKSGNWLNSVKIVLGMLELAFALKFLSNADLEFKWGVLNRELFLAIWIAIFASLTFYLFGRLKFKSDGDSNKMSIASYIMGLFFLAFTIYLIPGLFKYPLRLISGFPPPSYYSEWNTEGNNCPLGLNCYHDYESAMLAGIKESKPVLLDFTGINCVNCRKMEENVWIDPEVFRMLNEDYIVASLYCDKPDPLPESEYFTKMDGETGTTVGEKWAQFQIKYYKQNAQPLYVLIDNKGKLLADPRNKGYMSKSDYVSYLEEGLCRYAMRKKNTME